jgi:excisionase family DNA binding protein
MNKGVFTTQEFAEKSGVSSSTVSKWIRSGKIKARKQDGKWLIPADQSPSKSETPPPKDTKKAAPAAVQPKENTEKYYSVEEFSAMTYLTPFGVGKWLKEGRLKGVKDNADRWQVAASNLENSTIKRLLRN